MTKVAGIVDWGIEVETRTDLFGEEHKDAILGFGRYRGLYLGERSRHYLGWLFVTKEHDWPDELLALVKTWGQKKSLGKDETWSELVRRMKLDLASPQSNSST